MQQVHTSPFGAICAEATPAIQGITWRMLAERLLHDLVVLAPESLGDLGKPGEMLVAQPEKRVYGDCVPLSGGRDAEADGIEFYPLFGVISVM